jgi:PIN domain nuclease of toxin-antitoxin system
MRLLIDSGVWWWHFHGLPLDPALSALMRDGTHEFHLCPLSIAEMLYKWRHKPGQLPAPHPDQWLENSLKNYRLAHLSKDAARLAGIFDWKHGDPVDRCLAALAKTEGLTLIHTDTVLKDLPGFPQRYFPKVEIKTPCPPVSPRSSGSN